MSTGRMDLEVPTERVLREGVEAFRGNESRQYVYRATLVGIDTVWGNPSDMADQVLALLSSWNERFYSINGIADRSKIAAALEESLPTLSCFRYRHISSLDAEDEEDIRRVFVALLEATEGMKTFPTEEGPRTSSVGVAKALSIIAPEFFPLWDRAIAEAFGYSTSPRGGPEAKWEQYQRFCFDMKEWTIALEDQENAVLQNYGPSATLKLIDEYNYANYTRDWI